MTAIGTVGLEILACSGMGVVALKGLGVFGSLNPLERVSWAFVLGFGILGWVLFFLGITGNFQGWALIALLAVGALGNLFAAKELRRFSAGTFRTDLKPVDLLLVAGIASAIFFDVSEALSPPADGDSMTYHFAFPKQFLSASGLLFTPRAADGAVPLLVQMTYVPALGLGGERGLTLWTMVTGWAAAFLLFSLARRFLDTRWSLACVLLFVTTPAVVYGVGSGQVEVRNAFFVMVAAMAVSDALRTGSLRYVAVAGLAAGFFIGAKYLGLLFAAAAGLTILGRRGALMRGAVFSAAALAAGFQWYAWNWLNTGDPVFPLLFGFVEYRDPALWNEIYQAGFQSVFDVESPAPTNPLWFLAYPFIATFAGLAQFESGRTGFGPIYVMLLPFAFAGLWHYRRRLTGHPLFPVAAIVTLFYAFWFFTGSSQRVRHLLPVLPLLLLCTVVAAQRWGERAGTLYPLAGAVILACLVQMAGHGLFALNHLRFLFTDETRDVFLSRNIGAYGAVSWINRNLSKDDRLFVTTRELVYHVEPQVVLGHAQFDARVDISQQADDPDRLLEQLRGLGITHYLTDMSSSRAADGKPRGLELWRALASRGCLVHLRDFDTWTITSRTLFAKGPADGRISLYRIEAGPCGS